MKFLWNEETAGNVLNKMDNIQGTAVKPGGKSCGDKIETTSFG